MKNVRTLLAAALLLGAGPLAAQDGRVVGRAVSEADGTPIAYALLRLAPAAGGSARTAATDAQGRFTLEAVAPGAYRVTLARIGFAPEEPVPVTVRPGAETTVEIRVRPRALEIAPLVVSDACYTERDLARAPAIRQLWDAARLALETRRAIDETFEYRYVTVQFTRYLDAEGNVSRADTVGTLIQSTPRARAENVRRRLREGWVSAEGASVLFEMPDGMELLAPDFLRRYCLEASSGEGDGVWELAFRPVRPRRRGADVRAVLRMDRATFQIRSIEAEHIADRRTVMSTRLDFQDVALEGGSIRFPHRAVFTGSPFVLRRGVEGEMIYQDLGGFRAVPAPRR